LEQLTMPAGRDIYLEAEGRRLAAVESYRAQAVREVYPVEVLGSDQPAGLVRGAARYRLELKRVVFQGDVDFYGLSGFNVVIVRPGARVVYTGCEWEQIAEGAAAGGAFAENVVISARRRRVL
jgi:uncharacterized membrane protein